MVEKHRSGYTCGSRPLALGMTWGCPPSEGNAGGPVPCTRRAEEGAGVSSVALMCRVPLAASQYVPVLALTSCTVRLLHRQHGRMADVAREAFLHEWRVLWTSASVLSEIRALELSQREATRMNFIFGVF